MSNNQPLSPHRAQNLSEEQLVGLIRRVDRTLDELEELTAVERQLTHEKHSNPALDQVYRELVGFRLRLTSTLLRVRTIGR